MWPLIVHGLCVPPLIVRGLCVWSLCVASGLCAASDCVWSLIVASDSVWSLIVHSLCAWPDCGLVEFPGIKQMSLMLGQVCLVLGTWRRKKFNPPPL